MLSALWLAATLAGTQPSAAPRVDLVELECRFVEDGSRKTFRLLVNRKALNRLALVDPFASLEDPNALADPFDMATSLGSDPFAPVPVVAPASTDQAVADPFVAAERDVREVVDPFVE